MTDKEGQVIQYIDGTAWGIAPDGRTVCLGTETDIRTILANLKHHPENLTIAQVVSLERNLARGVATVIEKKQTKEKAERAERKKGFIFSVVPIKTRKLRKIKNRA